MYTTLTFCFLFTVVLAQDKAVQDFKKGNVLFSADFYKKLVTSQKNSFLASPLSLEFALALLQSGAKGVTAEQIRSSIHLPQCEKEIEDAIKTLISSLSSSQKYYTFDIANKIYVMEKYYINLNYKKIAAEVYQAGTENIDFNNASQAAKTINAWVANQTHDKIKDLINPNKLNNNTRAVLLNTIYLNGNWSIQFDEKATNKSDFYITPTNVVQVDTMHQSFQTHKYKECDILKAKFLQLDLLYGNASVVFILPNNKSGLTNLEAQIEDVLKVEDLSWETVYVALPKFKIETTLQSLVSVLQDLGVKAVFDPKQADLSGISGRKGDLTVNEVLQKTYIDVKEGGIEAAAATAIIIGHIPNSHQHPPPPPPQKLFIADHPFIFYVKVQGIIVFEGRYIGPNN